MGLEVGLAERGQRRGRTAVRAESIRDASHLSIPTNPDYEVYAAKANLRTLTWLCGEPSQRLRRIAGTLYWDVAAAFCRGRSPEVERIAGRVAMQKVFSILEMKTWRDSPARPR